MPKATIYEHSNLATREDDVSGSAQLRNRARVDAIPQTSAMKFAP
jgi:hypothetical protein